jgi:hypothetical protein
MSVPIGVSEKQQVVGIEPNGQGSLFQLVYVEAQSDDKDKRRTEETLCGAGSERDASAELASLRCLSLEAP